MKKGGYGMYMSIYIIENFLGLFKEVSPSRDLTIGYI